MQPTVTHTRHKTDSGTDDGCWSRLALRSLAPIEHDQDHVEDDQADDRKRPAPFRAGARSRLSDPDRRRLHNPGIQVVLDLQSFAVQRVPLLEGDDERGQPAVEFGPRLA